MLVLHTLVRPVRGSGEIGDDASQPLLGLDRVLLQQQQSTRQVANLALGISCLLLHLLQFQGLHTDYDGRKSSCLE